MSIEVKQDKYYSDSELESDFLLDHKRNEYRIFSNYPKVVSWLINRNPHFQPDRYHLEGGKVVRAEEFEPSGKPVVAVQGKLPISCLRPQTEAVESMNYPSRLFR